MKKKLITLLFLFVCITGYTQTAKDLFVPSEVRISWLGIDFSHIKLIGEFSEIGGAGEKSVADVRSNLFPSWNRIVINEPKKYDIKGMLRKDSIIYDLDMIMEKNSKTPLETLEGTSTPNYSDADIAKFVKEYNTEGKTGISIIMIAESFSKPAEEAFIHFVAFNPVTKEVLIHERLREKPQGFGVRNYWARTIYNAMETIRKSYYKTWKEKYAGK